jgi:hypothetical protein
VHRQQQTEDRGGPYLSQPVLPQVFTFFETTYLVHRKTSLIFIVTFFLSVQYIFRLWRVLRPIYNAFYYFFFFFVKHSQARQPVKPISSEGCVFLDRTNITRFLVKESANFQRLLRSHIHL